MPLSREDVLIGLREFATDVSSQTSEQVVVNIVGGAALQLAYLDRQITDDIDARISTAYDVQPIIFAIGERHGWPRDWLNTSVMNFWPPLVDYDTWTTIIDEKNVHISVAPAELLLAMKILASRPGRDINDIAALIEHCGVREIADVDDIVDRYFPGESVPIRALEPLNKIFAAICANNDDTQNPRRRTVEGEL